MQHFSQNIALFTAPALKNSRKIFQEYGLYIFSDSSESGFKEEVVSQATHIGLGEKYACQWDEWNVDKYVKISLIGEILERWNFEIDFEWEKVTKIFHNPSKNISDKTLLDFMQKFLEESIFYKENGELKFWTQKKWKYIFVNPENIISLSENVLYPSKSVASFVLNVDNDGKYIESKHFINTLKISENVYLNKKHQCLLVRGDAGILKKWEMMIANSLKKVPLGEDNSELYTNILEKILAFPEGFSFNDFTEFESIKATDYPEKKKAFSRANFSHYLDFDINISARGFVTKTEKKEKKSKN